MTHQFPTTQSDKPKDGRSVWLWLLLAGIGLCALLVLSGVLNKNPTDPQGDADRFVEALLANPTYQDYLADASDFTTADAGLLVEAMMSNPTYQGYLETTPAEDCATVILMAAVLSGEYELPTGADKARLCDWYARESTQ